jgi:4-carboxymuconolactone decarboxylase
MLEPRAGSPTAAESEARLPIEVEIAELQGLYATGEVWSRSGLDLKTRSLLTIGILTSQYALDELHVHVSNALNLGVTPEEIHETLLHAGVYSGLSAWTNAKNVARDVFVKRGILEP